MTLHENEVFIDEAVVLGLLRAQRPELCELPLAYLGAGTDNMMFRLGDDHLVRLPRTPEKSASLEKELAWLPRLASHLPCRTPQPLFVGRPVVEYPLPWAVYSWLDGSEVSATTVSDWGAFGRDLADFVRSLHAVDLMDATRIGDLIWYRGGTLQPTSEWVPQHFSSLRSHSAELDLDRLERLWREALELPPPSSGHVWLHGDLRPTNVLVEHGRLSAVIDFGGLSIGHPDAEHATTWDLPAAARDSYRSALGLDDLTWARARAWSIAVGVAGIAYYWDTFPAFVAECTHRLRAILAESD